MGAADLSVCFRLVDTPVGDQVTLIVTLRRETRSRDFPSDGKRAIHFQEFPGASNQCFDFTGNHY